MRKCVIFFLFILLSASLLAVSTGCSRKRDPSQAAPASRFAEEMNGYVGGPSSKLFARFGVYDGMITTPDGKTIYEWHKSERGISIWTGIRYSECEVRAVVGRDDIVEGWSSSGRCK
ncbi:exported hypothetical protein [uncultured delta proteobacterium]|uniref:Lipoprotein n=1 Tax=uncultured delta proteobacterium TaxID=34034 RepID=A0A212JPH0_9DELT|nr:exported hypothetical protein [uncultured delta proteobacterium]